MALTIRSLEQCAEIISGWEQKCSNLHGNKCRTAVSIPDRPSQHAPDWVIDTVKGCIVPGKSIDHYAALSYVWDSPGDSSGEPSTASKTLLLQRDNLTDLQSQRFLFSQDIGNHLPMVIRDSIQLVSQSHARYLWVDRLCTVQNDPRTRDQVNLFPEIYCGALFTIIAAAEGSGLLGSITHVGSPTRCISAKILHAELLSSRWATRGWTFQEHLLSERSIIFLDRAVFWDCQSSVWWPQDERSQEPAADGEHQVTTTSLNKSFQGWHDPHQSMPLASLHSTNFALYRELVCRYNNRELTHPQDALPAFSSVLDSAFPTLQDGFISGLPRPVLDSFLLWQPRWRAKRRTPASSGHGSAPLPPLPSWSWIGWQCLVDPKSLPDYPDSQLHGWVAHYPSPMTDKVSTYSGPKSVAFISKTTTRAEFRIRRILVPCSRLEPLCTFQAASAVSVFDTPLYKNNPELDTLCPIITLETHEGKWAGLLKVMDGVPHVAYKQSIELIAISRGSCSYWDAASTFEATVDRLGCYRFESHNGDHYHFGSPGSVPLTIEEGEKISAGFHSANKLPRRLPPSPVFAENIQSGRDPGPLFPSEACGTHAGYEEVLPEAWHDKIFEFYNVLWVETRENIRYRKAAGLVSKEIWEQSCGAPQLIVLG